MRGHISVDNPPLVSSMLTNEIPAGTGKSTFGCPAVSPFIYFVQIGTAPSPPESPIGALSSKPIHVSARVFGVKPMNHASRLSFVVPVFPAAMSLNPIERALAAVPRSRTPFITLDRMYMSRAGNTCTGCTTSPADT